MEEIKKDYLFKVKTIEDIHMGNYNFYEGSVIYVKKDNLKKHYRGLWASRLGTFIVKVPKNKCVKLDDL